MWEIRILYIAADPDIQGLMTAKQEYSPISISSGLYYGVPQEVRTLGVKAVLVANADMSDDNAYKIAKTIFSQLDYFKKLHPILNDLAAAEMIKQGQMAPIHAGAAKYYREAGYIK
jgi:TRAP transporter TAXI family solute receptor